jgi:hypothetical protein
MAQDSFRECPYCREGIPEEATRCRFCGSSVTGSTKPTHGGKCPQCLSEIDAEATVCRYCRAYVGPVTPMQYVPGGGPDSFGGALEVGEFEVPSDGTPISRAIGCGPCKLNDSWTSLITGAGTKTCFRVVCKQVGQRTLCGIESYTEQCINEAIAISNALRWSRW